MNTNNDGNVSSHTFESGQAVVAAQAMVDAIYAAGKRSFKQ